MEANWYPSAQAVSALDQFYVELVKYNWRMPAEHTAGELGLDAAAFSCPFPTA